MHSSLIGLILALAFTLAPIPLRARAIWDDLHGNYDKEQ